MDKIQLIFLLLLMNCSTTGQQSIVIKSNPPAQVSVLNEKGDELLSGASPQALDLKKGQHSSELLRIIVSTPGYVPENILLPFGTTSSNTGEIVVNLKRAEDWVDGQSLVSSKVANEISKESINIFKMIKNGELDKALKVTQNFKIRYPFAPIFYEIEGAIYTLEGKLELAANSYNTSLKLDPSNQDVKEISSYIEKQLGRRAP